MDACHLLLWRQWKYDRKVIYDDFKIHTHLRFTMQQSTNLVSPVPLAPLQDTTPALTALMQFLKRSVFVWPTKPEPMPAMPGFVPIRRTQLGRAYST